MSASSFSRGIVRALVRPVWRRIWVRIAAHIDARVAELGRSDQVLLQHPAAFLDAVSTVAALGRRVRGLQQQVEALQRQRVGAAPQITLVPSAVAGTIEVSFSTDNNEAVTSLLRAARDVLTPGATVRLRLHCPAQTEGARPGLFEEATATASWLCGNDFADVRIDTDPEGATSSCLTVSARLAA